ncbi:hypothetical protein [uncultured Bradyrhizobium sp.]|uniref:hypothetical protein n=1 Tax=uncultured Bradyrhizobium sp. TaxID=199684 RepID=UPI0035CA50E8
MVSKQDEPNDDVEAIAEGFKLMRAFRSIASPEARRKVIELAMALAKESDGAHSSSRCCNTTPTR